MVGPLRFAAPPLVREPRPGPVRDPEAEIVRFSAHVAALYSHLQETIKWLRAEARQDEAAILDVHVDLLQGDRFRQQAHDAIRRLEMAAEEAVVHVAEDLASPFEAPGSAMASRWTSDLRDLFGRLQRRLPAVPSILSRDGSRARHCTLLRPRRPDAVLLLFAAL